MRGLPSTVAGRARAGGSYPEAVLVVAHAVSASFEPVQILPPLIAGVGYAVRARTLARQGRPVPTWRRTSFWAGIALILTTLVSPIANAGHELILAHMVQHLLLADIGALLLVLGCTGPLLQPLLGLPVFKQLRVLVH